MAVLYQKYRPQRFADVIGQEPIVQTLRNAAKNSELAHAYLFTGSRGVGKTTIARLLAKAVNCQKLKDGDPCGQCDVCNAVASGTALDIIEIDAASHTGVDNVRELIEHASFRPTSLAMKVFIIDEVHMLSKAAFNALLKTLEEPPGHVMFILATTDIEKVPDTIVSRTQRFDFKRIPETEMTQALVSIAKDQKLKLPAGVIEAVVAQAEGSMRDALSKLDMVSSLGQQMTLESTEKLLGITPLATVQELLSLISNHDSSALPEFFEAALASGVDPTVFNRSVLSYLRKLLNAKLAGDSVAKDSSLQTKQQQELFAAHLAAQSLPQLLFMIRLFLRSYKELAQAPMPELPLLLAAIEASLHGTSGASQPQSQPQPQAQAVAMTPVAPQVSVKEQEAPEQPIQPPVTSQQTAQKAPKLATNKDLDASVSLAELQVWWPDVISRIKAENSPIATLLKNSPVTDVSNGKITVAVKYLFHKEHLDNKKHAALIVETIEAVSGKHLAFKAVIQNHIHQPIADTVDALSDAIKVFGGELIE